MAAPLKLGQIARMSDDPIWLFVQLVDGRYVLWTEDDDEEFRDMLRLDPADELPRVRIRRWGNPDRSAFERKQSRRYNKLGSIPEKIWERITRESIARHVLVDWQGIAPPGHESSAAYTVEVGLEVLEKDPDFTDAIVSAAVDAEHFRGVTNEEADALGN